MEGLADFIFTPYLFPCRITAGSSSLISDKQTSVEGSGAIAAGAQVDYVAFAAPNTMLSYQATVVIGNDTIVTDVLFG